MDHNKPREASQNTDLNMSEFLGIDKALQTIKDKLANIASKLTEVNERIKKDSKKLKVVEYDLSYYEERNQLYRDNLNLNNLTRQRE